MTEEGTTVRGLTRRRAVLTGVGGGLGLAAAATLANTDAAFAQTPAASPAATGPLTATAPMLTLEGALAVLQAALAKARALGVPEVVAVVDAAGTPKALARMDGTPNSSIDIARDKAFTAASFHAPTHQLAAGIGGSPVVLASILKAPGVTLLGGGYPLTSGTTVIGGIGCSGGTQEQDQACAEAGVAALPKA